MRDTDMSHAVMADAHRSGLFLLRLGLAAIFLLFSAAKITPYEAQGIQPFVANSPLLGWANGFGVQGASYLVGALEALIGLLLIIGFWRPQSLAALLGAFGSCIVFLVTLSFLLTSPGVLAPSEQTLGLPVPSADVGQFLLKDLVLLAASAALALDSMALRRLVGRPATSATRALN